MSSHEVRVLRAALFRISASLPQDLPVVIPRIARDLQDCKGLLSGTSVSGKESSSTVQVHKLRTQINTFLSAKTPEAKWAGTILTKALIELGGLDIISKCGPWARLLLQNLNKPDPASSKKLVIITLTRIFDLTVEHQSLSREITTPILKDFVPACLNLISPKAKGPSSSTQKPVQHPLLPTIFESFAHLLPFHPSIFRPHLAQLKRLLIPLIAPVSSLVIAPKAQEAAQRLFSLLPFSAPKSNTASPAKEASEVLKAIVATIHATASLFFRSIREDWSPMPGTDTPHVNVPTDLELGSANYEDALGLPSWQGLRDGASRLRGLLDLISSVILSPTPDQINLPLAHIVDLIVRLCSMTVPVESLQGKGKTETHKSSINANDQISQTERDDLLTELPGIHAVAMELISALCARLGNTFKPLHDICLDQIVWVFQRESFSDALRIACFTATCHILEGSGSGLTKSTVQQIVPLLESCCADLLSPNSEVNKKADTLATGLSPDVLIPSTKSPGLNTSVAAASTSTPLSLAASDLLVTALRTIQPTCLTSRVRARLDRTAILTQNKDAILASVLNPPAAAAGSNAVPTSILPFLARAAPNDLATEALLRPRLPAVRSTENGAEEASESEAEQGAQMEISGRHSLQEDDAGDDVPAVSGKTGQFAPGSTTLLAPSTTEPAASGLKRPYDFALTDGHLTASGPEPKRARGDQSIQPTAVVNKEEDVLNELIEDTPLRTLQVTAAPKASTKEVQGVEVPAAPRPMPAAPASAVASTAPATQIDSDDSDFSIPEINMDPDTEDEEDEEDKDGMDAEENA